MNIIICLNVQIEELKQQLKDSTEHSTVVNLEEKIDILKEDLERVNENLEAEKQNSEVLKATVTKLEKESESLLFLFYISY